MTRFLQKMIIAFYIWFKFNCCYLWLCSINIWNGLIQSLDYLCYLWSSFLLFSSIYCFVLICFSVSALDCPYRETKGSDYRYLCAGVGGYMCKMNMGHQLRLLNAWLMGNNCFLYDNCPIVYHGTFVVVLLGLLLNLFNLLLFFMCTFRGLGKSARQCKVDAYAAMVKISSLGVRSIKISVPAYSLRKLILD